jgi:hypothetical protein
MDQQKPEAWRATTETPDRVERPLGRGLGDISHLFLSRRSETRSTPEVAPGREAAATPLQPGCHARTLLLQPCPTITKDALASLVRDLHSSLEEGLRVLDGSIPCHPFGEIDLLALDRANQLTVIDFDVVSNDSLLLRGIGHFDWLLHNLPNIRRMYPGYTINYLAPPRVILLAPRFSPSLRIVARHLTRPHVDWVRYHVVAAAGTLGMLFEREGAD